MDGDIIQAVIDNELGFHQQILSQLHRLACRQQSIHVFSCLVQSIALYFGITLHFVFIVCIGQEVGDG